MSAPWDQTSGYMSNTLTNPYRRLMNTSGVAFRDHAGSMVCLFGLRCEPNVLFSLLNWTRISALNMLNIEELTGVGPLCGGATICKRYP